MSTSQPCAPSSATAERPRRIDSEMQCFINCLAPPQGQGITLPAAGKTHAARIAAEARRNEPPWEGKLADLTIEDIGKPSSPLGLKMRQLQGSNARANGGAPTASSTRSGSTWSSKGSSAAAAGRAVPPLKAIGTAAMDAMSEASSGGISSTFRGKATTLAEAKAAEAAAKVAEQRAAMAMAEATKRGMAFAMHAPGVNLNPRRAPPTSEDKSKALEAARAAAAKAKADGGIKPGVQQAVKPRHVSPANSRRGTPVHSRSSSPANSYRAKSRPLDPDAPPPSYMNGLKNSSVPRPTKSDAGSKLTEEGRIGPAETGRLDWDRMRWDEKYS